LPAPKQEHAGARNQQRRKPNIDEQEQRFEIIDVAPQTALYTTQFRARPKDFLTESLNHGRLFRCHLGAEIAGERATAAPRLHFGEALLGLLQFDLQFFLAVTDLAIGVFLHVIEQFHAPRRRRA
jgi:hypothetical protein